MATLVGRIAPSLPIHASTQMSITSADGADFARQLGAKRVVVGRELSVADISKVSAGTDAEVEAFVHGALCVSYRCGPHACSLSKHSLLACLFLLPIQLHEGSRMAFHTVALT